MNPRSLISLLDEDFCYRMEDTNSRHLQTPNQNLHIFREVAFSSSAMCKELQDETFHAEAGQRHEVAEKTQAPEIPVVPDEKFSSE